jgi:hypothetical protein
MAVEEGARCNFGLMKFQSSINERAVKNWVSSRNEIDSTLEAYNNSCAG